MDSIDGSSIVVGIDGSPASDQALVWAVEEAARRRLVLHCVGACGHEAPFEADPLAPPGTFTYVPSDRTTALVRTAVDLAKQAAPGLEVTSQVVDGFPASTLLALSEHADTVVLGNRGHSLLSGTLLGSVATQVTTHARCPVVVVRAAIEPTWDTGINGVVVGVDAGSVSEPALAYGFAQADARSCRLDVVHVWWSSVPVTTDGVRAEQVARQELALAEMLAGWTEKYPGVAVHRHLPVGPTVATLVEASQHARLLVVGSRGRGGFRRLLLGSVGQGVLHHAQCPVAVVRTRGHESSTPV